MQDEHDKADNEKGQGVGFEGVVENAHAIGQKTN